MLRKKLIIAGLIIALSLMALRAYFVFDSDFHISLFGLILSLSQRGFVLLIGVGLIGLRWFLVHRHRPDNDGPDSAPASSAAKDLR
jgi:hypothetical protein